MEQRDLRQTLIEVGGELIARNGVSALTLRSAGAAAGVSRQAPYHHFRDKTEMLEAIAIAGFERLGALLAAVAARHDAPAERLIALGEAYVALATAEPRMFELLSGALFADPDAHADLAAARDNAVEVLEQAVAAHCRETGTRTPRTTATAAAWSLAHGIARLSIEGAITPNRRQIRATLRLLVNGLRH